MNQKSSGIKIDISKEGIREVVLNRPERRNALSLGIMEELRKVFAEKDDAVRVIVLSAAGSTFCAGGDLAELGGGEESDVQIDMAIEQVVEAIKSNPVPVIAAVEGACIGAGVDILLACDLCVIASRAYLHIPAVQLGLLYSPAGIKRMQRRVGHAALRRLLLLGEKLDAEEVCATGAATHLSAAGLARTKAMDLALQVKQGVPAALEASKRYLMALENDNLDDDDWENERRRLLRSTERQKAVAEKRNSLKTGKN